MKNIIITLLVLGGLVLILFVGSRVYAPVTKKQTQTPTNNQTQGQKTPLVIKYYYPISNYNQRIKIHQYGTLVKSGDEKKLVCGRAFSGYHTGDDLEVFTSEANTAISINSIAAGTVKEVAWVNGYGGLVVIEHDLSGQIVTAYYGHLNINSVTVKPNAQVSAGQIIGRLGQGCSYETDYERKHLHFDIHKGTTIDVRGYVPTLSELVQWLDPKKELANLGAK